MREAAEGIAQRFLDLEGSLPSAISSNDLDESQAGEVRAIARDMARLDQTAKDSLELRAQGLQVVSMQPHVRPRMPVFIHWAFVPRPTTAIEFEIPPLDSVDLTGLKEEADV